MDPSRLPSLNALLNLSSLALLLLGFRAVRRGDIRAHKRWMLSALVTSAAFLTSYCVYHAAAGSVPYPRHDWTRPLYFAILIPHLILAAVNAPAIAVLVWWALRGRIARHRRLARWLLPSWLFVSASGVAVYWMLYRL